MVDGQLIRVKVGAGRVKAEHDDVATAARRTGLPLRELAFRAEAAWAEAQRTAPAGPGALDTCPLDHGGVDGGVDGGTFGGDESA